MIRELVCDDAVLSTPCAPATAEDAELALQPLVGEYATVLFGAGLVGASFYKGDDERDYVLYNPKMLMGLGPQKLVESCMTHEGESRVTRFIKIKVAYDELVDGVLVPRKKEFFGWEAQMVQHMIDHCKGKLV